jgi:hypothetical protein
VAPLERRGRSQPSRPVPPSGPPPAIIQSTPQRSASWSASSVSDVPTWAAMRSEINNEELDHGISGLLPGRLSSSRIAPPTSPPPPTSPVVYPHI